jgi:broad specificity phosphatase PhoE
MAKSMRVHLLRHAQSLFNKEHKGGPDCALSEKGRLQASLLEGSFDTVVLSPLLRCKQTLALSKITSSHVVECELCREHRTDTCDFKEGEDIHALESEQELRARVQQFRRYLFERFDGRSVLIVGHADFFFALTSSVGGDGEIYGKWLHNAEILQVDIQID